MSKHTFSNRFIKQFRTSVGRVESGQAVVLVALLMIALIGIGGLAIDGGEMYRAHRNTQNALDASLLSSSFALCTGGTSDEAIMAGYITAEDNGFVAVDPAVGFLTDSPHGQIYIQNPPPEGTPHANDPAYIYGQAKRQSTSHLIKAVYEGATEITVEGTVRCEPGINTSDTDYYSFVTLNDDSSGGFYLDGCGCYTAYFYFCGGGVWSNSDADKTSRAAPTTMDGCLDPQWHAVDTGGSNIPGITSDGAAISDPLEALNPPEKPATCGATLTGGTYEISGPTCYNGISLSNTASLTITGDPGRDDNVLYIEGDIRSSSSRTNLEISDVLIYVTDDVMLGTSDWNFTPSYRDGADWYGMSMWVVGDDFEIKNNTNEVYGTYYMPNADAVLTGGSDNVWYTQFIANTIHFVSEGGDHFVYNEDYLFQAPPVISIVE